MQSDIVKIQPYHPGLEHLWNSFCNNHKEAWFWHTAFWMEYSLDCRFGVQTENMSYLLLDNDGRTVYAIVPLIKETSSGTSEFTYGGGPTPAPIINAVLREKKKNEVKQFIFEYYRKLAEQHQVQRIVLRHSNMKMTEEQNPEPVYLRNAFMELPSYTSVLSLQSDEEVIYKKMHDNHKWMIRKAQRLNAKVDVYDKTSISKEIMDDFINSYSKAAGKPTRPHSTFEKWHQFIQMGNGYLFKLKVSGEILGYVYILVYKNYAYYCMSCQLGGSEVGSHIIQWEIIKFLKSKKIHFYELGEQFFSSTPYAPASGKIMTISRFKRRFGGSLVPQWTAEYFYSGEYMKTMWNGRLEAYLKSLKNDLDQEIDRE